MKAPAFKLLLVLMLATACRRPPDSKTPPPTAAGAPVPQWHLQQLQAIDAPHLDLQDPQAVFHEVFSQLPPEVSVFPTENYYYWRMHCRGKDIWGNIRLASGQREKGFLSFGFQEHLKEFTIPSSPQIRHFSAADGVIVRCPTPFSSIVTVGSKSVVFHFQEISQQPPPFPIVRLHEMFIQRTCDESGLRFLLLWHAERHFLSWVLDEAEPVPDQFTLLPGGFALGERTGFLFWQDGERKILAAVRHRSREENNYFDGPFDQLADNYAEESRIQHFLELAYPDCRGNIDSFGYFTDHRAPKRVAVMTYSTYHDPVATAQRLKGFIRNSLDLDFSKIQAQ
ncbi:MAG: hypothetical protein KA004_10725 [Verrucomicrobiales bacterium]|nr:hypothetical protein [Verrucomicrobiales bacterium]